MFFYFVCASASFSQSWFVSQKRRGWADGKLSYKLTFSIALILTLSFHVDKPKELRSAQTDI